MVIKTFMLPLYGKRVQLRPAKLQDVEDRLSLGPNPEYHQYFGDGLTEMRSRDELKKMWFEEVAEDPNGVLVKSAELQITQIEADGKWIGSASLGDISFVHRRAKIVVGIYNRNYWGQGYGVEVMDLVLKYAFEVLKLHRVSGNVLATNKRSLAASRKLGFRKEGVLRDYYYLNYSWCDSVLVGITEDEYRARVGLDRD